jgi:predicted nucleic acid-binding protein
MKTVIESAQMLNDNSVKLVVHSDSQSWYFLIVSRHYYNEILHLTQIRLVVAKLYFYTFNQNQ